MTRESLVTLTMAFTELERQILEADGELTPDLEDLMNINSGDMREKIDAYKFFMDHLDARAAYLQDVERQFYAARKCLESMKDRLKDNLKYSMRTMNVESIEGNQWRYKLSNLRDKCVIDDKQLPAEWFTEVVTKVPDKERIQENLLLGAIIQGATMEPVTSIRSYVNHEGRARDVIEDKAEIKQLKGKKNGKRDSESNA